MAHQTHYSIRFLARLIDILFIGALVSILNNSIEGIEYSLLICYIGYNLIVIIVRGNTLGKYSLSLTVETPKAGIAKTIALLSREILFYLFSPILVLNAVCSVPTALHDKIAGTEVIRNAK